MIVETRNRRRSKRWVKLENVPSPERIREMTAEIRRSWKPRDFCRRSNTVDYVDLMQMPLQPRRKGFWGD